MPSWWRSADWSAWGWSELTCTRPLQGWVAIRQRFVSSPSLSRVTTSCSLGSRCWWVSTMAVAAVVLTGSPEVNRALAELKGPKQKEAIRKASRAALRPVLDQVRTTAPKRTGQLSRSVKVRALTRSRSRVGARVSVSARSNFKGKAFYAGFQEYGWKVGRRVRNSDLGMDPKNWARRTATQKAEAAKRNAARRQVKGTEWMKKAAQAKRQMALGIYRAETIRWVRQLSKAK